MIGILEYPRTSERAASSSGAVANAVGDCALYDADDVAAREPTTAEAKVRVP